MKRTLSVTAFSIITLVYNTGLIHAQDYEKGRQAYLNDDYPSALKELRPLAEQGDDDSRYYLGLMYLRGLGVIQDYKEAARLFANSAEQGHTFAQGLLGRMYSEGLGVNKNPIYAHMWWNIAGANGYGIGATFRDSEAKRMSSSQVEEAQRLARECIIKMYKEC